MIGGPGVKLIGANICGLLLPLPPLGLAMTGAKVLPVIELEAKVKKYKGATVVVKNRWDGQQTIISKPS